jgi:hypothetical protein
LLTFEYIPHHLVATPKLLFFRQIGNPFPVFLLQH